VVSRGWAQRALIQLAYAIGEAEPVSFAVETFGTQSDPRQDIAAELSREFDLTPAGIIQCLDLQRPIYYPTAAYGHFGRDDLQLPWEQDIPCPDLLTLQRTNRASSPTGASGPDAETTPLSLSSGRHAGAGKTARQGGGQQIQENYP
jgi:hypothetical protein